MVLPRAGLVQQRQPPFAYSQKEKRALSPSFSRPSGRHHPLILVVFLFLCAFSLSIISLPATRTLKEKEEGRRKKRKGYRGNKIYQRRSLALSTFSSALSSSPTPTGPTFWPANLLDVDLIARNRERLELATPPTPNSFISVGTRGRGSPRGTMTLYVDDAPHVMGAVVTLMMLAFVSYGLRVYVRMGKTWGSEDWAMTIGTVSLSLSRGRPHHQRIP